MQTVTLKPAHFKPDGITATPDFISDGHWLIPKKFVANSALFATAESADAFMGKATTHRGRGLRRFAKILPTNNIADRVLAQKDGSSEFIALPVLVESHSTGLVRVFASETGDVLGLREDYCKFFGLYNVFSRGGSSCAYVLDSDGAVDLAIMPVRDVREQLNRIPRPSPQQEEAEAV